MVGDHMAEVIVFDIDGTLVNVSGLYDWVQEKRTDYDVYHDLVLEAPPNQWVIDELHQHWDRGHDIYLITVREQRYYAKTAEWMVKHSVPYHRLVMRRSGDTRSTLDVKRDLIQGVLDEGKRITLSYEDNPELIPVWKEFGIPVIEVPGWWAGE